MSKVNNCPSDLTQDEFINVLKNVGLKDYEIRCSKRMSGDCSGVPIKQNSIRNILGSAI